MSSQKLRWHAEHISIATEMSAFYGMKLDSRLWAQRLQLPISRRPWFDHSLLELLCEIMFPRIRNNVILAGKRETCARWKVSLRLGEFMCSHQCEFCPIKSHFVTAVSIVVPTRMATINLLMSWEMADTDAIGRYSG